METAYPTVSQSDIILTGDRPTGRMHLGHLVGSLRARVALQHRCRVIVLLADLQGLTDNGHNPSKVSQNIPEVLADYLACGIDPGVAQICLQSAVTELADVTVLLANLVTTARLHRNPTLRSEIASRGFSEGGVPAGFFIYPISQASDLLTFGATKCPAGDDQAPLIELTNDLAGALNRMAGDVAAFSAVEHLRSVTGRLPGTDGLGKASKSAKNAIALSDEPDEITSKVNSMYTDPNHLRAQDPGDVSNHVVLAYLEAFDPEPGEVAELKEQYARGGLGDMALKRRLNDVLQTVLAPIRERRRRLIADKGYLLSVLASGTEQAREMAIRQRNKVRDVLGVTAL